jgi:hypothetical protein
LKKELAQWRVAWHLLFITYTPKRGIVINKVANLLFTRLFSSAMSPDTDIFTSLPTCTGEKGWRLSYIAFTPAQSLFGGLYQARFLVVYEGGLLEEVGSEAGQISLREHGLHN